MSESKLHLCSAVSGINQGAQGDGDKRFREGKKNEEGRGTKRRGAGAGRAEEAGEGPCPLHPAGSSPARSVSAEGRAEGLRHGAPSAGGRSGYDSAPQPCPGSLGCPGEPAPPPGGCCQPVRQLRSMGQPGGPPTRPGSIVQTEQTAQRPGKASKEKGSHRGKRLSRGRKVSKRPPCRGDPDTKTTLFGFLHSGRKRTLLNKK